MFPSLFCWSGPRGERMSKMRPMILGELETAVMDRLWSEGPGDPKTVHADVGVPRGITHNTVQSTLKRLYEKGLLKRRKVSHSYVYEPRHTREEFNRDVIGEVVEILAGGPTSGVVAAFVDITADAGEDMLNQLEALVSERLADVREESS